MKGSRQRGITYGGQEKLFIEGYSDSDWAGDKESRKSTSGFIFMHIALTLAAKEATWLRLLLTELGLLQLDQQHALIKQVESENDCKFEMSRKIEHEPRL